MHREGIVKLPPPALSEPRSFAGLALRIAAMTFVPFALGMSWLVSTLLGMPFDRVLPFGLAGAAIFSIVFGWNNARHLQVETIMLKVEDRSEFVAKLNLATARLGYSLKAAIEGFYTYEPAFQTGWAAGSLSVQLSEKEATMVGPRVFVYKVMELLGKS